jgi:hypothetical protein
MRFSPFILGAATFILAAPGACPQTQCDTQTCTFTLSFDSAREGTIDSFRYVTGAPYSDQEMNESKRTLQDGTHTSSKTTGPLIYRDSKGRMRTEQSVYGRRSDSLPKPPDDFTVVEIHDPVAGFEYILDPVTHVAYRMAFKPREPQEFTSAMLRSPGEPSSFTTRNGLTITEETLGPQAMFGAAAVGVRRTNTDPPATPGEHSVVGSTSETWLDPKTGIILLRKDGSPRGDGATMTMLSYSNAEPDAALFQVPNGYKVVDETGPFKVVHTRTNPTGAVWSSAGPQSPRSSVNCDKDACTLTFDLISQQPMAAITGAPYSGRQVFDRAASTNPNGRQIPAVTRMEGATDRDSAGRIRTDRIPVSRGGGGQGPNGGQIPNEFPLVEIDDPVAGYQYILDTVDQVAYRAPWQARIIPFQPRPSFQPAGTRTFPDGTVDVEEDLSEKTLYGVTAVGHRSTQTSPPGTRQGNDKPIVSIVERWVDSNTGITLLQTQGGSEGGVKTSMSDYKAGDPDPSLFQIPSNYKIVDETGKFTFTITREQLNSQLR